MGPGDGEISDFPFHDYNPDYFLVNGKSGTDIHGDSTSKVEMDTDETLLIRLVNIGGYLPHRFIFNGLPVTAVSSDGRPLPIQEVVDEVTVYPGERYDVVIKPDSAGNYQVDIEYLSIYDASIQGIASVPIVVRNVSDPFDTDGDGVLDITDNCSNDANPGQEDTSPPGGNGIGDVCDCEGNFDGDNDCDGADAVVFKTDFGRSGYNSPCDSTNPCKGDFDCDNDCDGADAVVFKTDFGRSGYINPCSPSVTEPWCAYP
jgi:FtsP/CotA-like multicopper oxidase with cupredoxin domain